MCGTCGCKSAENCGCGQDPCKTYGAETFNAYSQKSRIQNLIEKLYDDREIALNKLLKINNPSLQNLISKNALLRDKVGDMTLAEWSQVQNQLKYTPSGRIRTFEAETFEESFITTDMSPSYIDVVVTDDAGSSFEGRLYGTMKENHSGAKKGLVSYDPSTGNVVYYHKGIEFVGDVENSDMNYDAETYEAETKKRKTGFRKCSKCGYSDHNSSNCNRLDEYETYRKHKDEMLRQCDRAIDEFTRDAKDYSEDGEYGMAKMRRSDATDMKKIKRMIENNHFGKAVHYARNLDSEPREYAPYALWMFYDAEEVKNAEFLYFYVLNEKGESPADFNTLEEAQTYVANSSEPLEIYERRSRDDEAYKMDKKMNAEYDAENRRKKAPKIPASKIFLAAVSGINVALLIYFWKGKQ